MLRARDALPMRWGCPGSITLPRCTPSWDTTLECGVVSRWPIVADEKLMLPHIGGLRHAQRTATAATVLVGTVKVRVYSAHLGTPSDIRPSKRRDQADMILADAAGYGLVIVAGDMNSHGIGKEFVANGFVWPTEHNGFTTAFFNWDHVFLKGFTTPARNQRFTGIVRDTLGTRRPRPPFGPWLSSLELGHPRRPNRISGRRRADDAPIFRPSRPITVPSMSSQRRIAASLIETHPAVRKVIPYDKRGSDHGWAGLRNLARRLQTERYERVYLPHRSLRTATLGVLAGIPTRIGFSGAWSFLYTEARPKPALGHESDRLLALADKPPGVYPPQLRPTPADEQAAATLIDGAFVALAPGSIWGSKRWPYYGELARQLADHTPLVVVGGQDDVGLGEEIRRAAEGGEGRRRVVNACGKLTLRQSAALIGKALLLVTNDSAPLHLATAMGTPIVALFGPTVTEFGFGPLRPGDVAIGIDELPCRPCSSHGPPQCPWDITAACVSSLLGP